MDYYLRYFQKKIILKRQANRNRPDFGESPQSYFEKLINEEKEQIIELLADK